MNEQYAIVLDNISKEYPGVKALNNVSFKVKKGSIHAFLGPNGAGKSTTMKIITGVIPQTNGSFSVNSSRAIGFLPETPPLYPNMNVEDYLKFVQEIFILKSNKEMIEEAIKRCGLEDMRKRLLRNLSKGYKQRVGIAQAMVINPEILILDEPTVGLDPIAMDEIKKLIFELKKDHTILLSTHQLHEAGELCEEITIINKGSVVSSGPVEKIRKELNQGQIVKVEFQDMKELSIDISFADCEKINEDGKSLILFKSNQEGDIRPLINEMANKENLMILSMYEQKLSLEDIFKSLT